ncbi:hypothetical protein F5148DRAFT_151133 [Russula earlei]|uniref:Uncharacterized protein n=1 Tax=Russula earlei TaxID=71964 RepID=A0ACC0U7K7_9AGAM|nr:hypothetical protein F5148DRAFT_151133 [Russula earlei]
MASNGVVSTEPERSLQAAVTVTPAHLQLSTTADATMANRSRRATSSTDMPKWLRPFNRESRPGHRDPARLAVTAQRPKPFTGHDPTQSQHRPSALPRKSAPLPSTTHRMISAVSPVLPSYPPITNAAKLNMPAMALGDEAQQEWRLHGIAGNASRGVVWMSEDEGTRIRAEAEAVKNLTRRVISSGGRARTTANSDDGTDTRLSWRLKTRSMPPRVVHPWPPKKPKSGDANRQIGIGIQERDITALPAASGSTLGISEISLPSSDVPPRGRERAQQGLGWVTGLPLIKFTKKIRCSSMPLAEQEAHSSEHVAETMSMTLDITSLNAVPPDEPGLAPPDLDRQHNFDSGDDISDSDTPLALLLPFWDGTRKRTLSEEGPQSAKKAKNKASAKSAVVDTSVVNASLDTAERLRSPSRAIVTATTEIPSNQSPHSNGESIKAKATTYNSDAQESPRTSRKVAGAKSSDTSDYEVPDDDLAIPGKYSISRSRPHIPPLWPSSPGASTAACQIHLACRGATGQKCGASY